MMSSGAWDRTLSGTPKWDAIRGTWAWKVLAWACTFVLVTAGLVLIRMPSWEAGGAMLHSLFGCELLSEWSGAIPVWVPVLLVLAALGHLFSAARVNPDRPLGVPSFVRAAVYVGALVLMVAFAPGVGKSFIYIAF